MTRIPATPAMTAMIAFGIEATRRLIAKRIRKMPRQSCHAEKVMGSSGLKQTMQVAVEGQIERGHETARRGSYAGADAGSPVSSLGRKDGEADPVVAAGKFRNARRSVENGRENQTPAPFVSHGH